MAKQKSTQFKQEAIAYVERNKHEPGGVEKACQNLGISTSTYYKWAAIFAATGTVKTVGTGNGLTEEQKEIIRLKKELKNREDALKILKKAISILGEEESK